MLNRSARASRSEDSHYLAVETLGLLERDHVRGAFVGMCCQDVAGTRRPADFDYFEYREREYRIDPRGVEVR